MSLQFKDAYEATKLDDDGFLNIKFNLKNEWKLYYCILHNNNLIILKDKINQEIIFSLQITSKIEIKDFEEENLIDFYLIINENEIISFSLKNEIYINQWKILLSEILDKTKNLSMDSFKIHKVIGKGFYGKVMLVEHINTGKFYAIKSIRKSRLEKSKKSHTILMERQILMKIHHPFIVQLYFAFQTSTKFYLGMEYISGGELFYHMNKRKKLPIEEVRLYVAEILIALSYLHSQDIIYRDLKPENVMLDSEGHIKLTDFGLSKTMEESSSTSTLCGTTDYLAPEIILRKNYSFEVDWWALGILTYEMLTEKTPFNNDNRLKMLNDIVHSTPVFPNYVSSDAIEFITALLSKDPKLRPSVERMKKFRFFKNLDWIKIKNREYKPLFLPQFDHLNQALNFDSEFTDENPTDSVSHTPFDNIPGFSYKGDEFFEESLLLFEKE